MTEELQVVDEALKKKVKKEKSKARKIVEWVLFGIFGALFAVVLAANISGIIHRDENYGQSIRFGFGNFIVLTNSMEPDIPQDSAIITYKESVESLKERFDRGDVIDLTFMNIPVDLDFEPDTLEFKRINGGTAVYSNAVMTHRLKEIHIRDDVPYGQGRYIFVTTGINNGGDYALIGQYQISTEKQYLGVVKVSNVFLGGLFSFLASPVGLIILLLVPAMYLIVMSSIDIFKQLKETEAKEQAAASSSPESARLAGLSEEDRERLKKELLDEMIAQKRGDKKDE